MLVYISEIRKSKLKTKNVKINLILKTNSFNFVIVIGKQRDLKHILRFDLMSENN